MQPDLSFYKRILVVGGPRSGKTTWVNEQDWGDQVIFHLDTHITHDWREDVEWWIRTLAKQPRFVAEGVKGAYLLVKGLEVDLVIRCEYARPTTPKQRALQVAEANKFWAWHLSHDNVPVHTRG